MQTVRAVIRYGIFVLGPVEGEDHIVRSYPFAGVDGLFVFDFGEVDIVPQEKIVLRIPLGDAVIMGQ
ncbi:hypothetical protein D1872_227600 [compost metagenome]